MLSSIVTGPPSPSSMLGGSLLEGLILLLRCIRMGV